MTISGTNITSNDSLTYVAKNRIYINKTHTYTQKGAENSLYQFCLTITKPFLSRGNEKRLSVSRTVNQVIMRVHKPTVAYKLALQDVVVTRRKQCFPQFELSFSLRVKYQFTFQSSLFIFSADNTQKHRVSLEKCCRNTHALMSRYLRCVIMSHKVSRGGIESNCFLVHLQCLLRCLSLVFNGIGHKFNIPFP